MAEETKGGNPNEQLLKDIREDFAYFRDYWRENYEEAKTDLRFVSGDPWDQDERRDREDNKRPVICPDELRPVSESGHQQPSPEPVGNQG
jgi:hypothetical protein